MTVHGQDLLKTALIVHYIYSPVQKSCSCIKGPKKEQVIVINYNIIITVIIVIVQPLNFNSSQSEVNLHRKHVRVEARLAEDGGTF